jgi:LCP family protein required for cell wall assembly
MNIKLQSIMTQKGWQRLLQVAFILLVIFSLAFFTFRTVRSLVTTWEITSLPGLAIKDPTPTPKPGEEPAATEDGDTPELQEPSTVPVGPIPDPWDGASRVTVLVMGLDYSDWRAGEGPPRTDTMILLTLDPISNTAGMLSIPRDLWVSIPGFDYGKINQAYQLGEAYKLPGGGPGLAMDTVEHLIGVPINYYAQIDFSVFVRFIDEIYGIKIDVPYEIYIDIYDDALGLKRIDPGVQVLPGEYALAYARARNTEGADFDRAQRQQQVIMGIRDRLLEPGMITDLIAKAPALYEELSSGINTNFALDEVIQLAWLAKGIPTENISRGIIGEEHVNFGVSPDGLEVLKPLPDQIRLLRDEVFMHTGAFTPAADPNADPLTLMVEENASIKLLNGTFTPGLAGRTMEYLQGLGANVIATNDAGDKPYPFTLIYDHTGNPYTIQYLVELMQVSKFRIMFNFKPDVEEDVTIILGNDWDAVNPMP